MPRRPKYRKHSNGIGFVEFNGKRHYLPGKYDSDESRNAYENFLDDHVGIARAPDPTTVLAITVRYVQYAAEYYGTDTRRHYGAIKRTCQLLNDYCGRTLINSLGPKAIKEWRESLIALGLARETINGHVGRVRAMLKWAASEELIDVSIHQAACTVAGLRKGRTQAPDPPKREAVSWDLVEPVLAALDNPVATMLFLQWRTGARPGSIVQAKPEQFRQSRNSEFLIWTPRHKQEYQERVLELPIGHITRLAIQRFLVDRPSNAFMFNPQEGRNGSNRRYNGHFTPWSYRQRIVRTQDRLGVPHWTPYQIRHTKGQWVREEFGLEHAQAALGHQSVKTTEIYASRLTSMAEEVVRSSG